ncbi:undecaprenyl diphosphate synthase [Beggiatoa alba B18LD]|uniref:Ditrans,polycis-undecaprenyl-diphosphate synthase ((2E,6E)-farnesyl-diphosphate specific) n=1 Tax=Beggiatoa alba B18LD TaxID=395493 RepID=I3CKD9_9GAMM|nr:isoprenyl transferase [Beggiatoa alba]EIJ44082.1 undecaprenyl diphosphate synthase [Beggiatoa alba B18LD]
MTKQAQTPRHVAIIMDGNGRWAKKRLLPRIAGHRAGVETVRKIVRCCTEQGIEVLTLFAFSSENWRRPEQEVSLLMELFMFALQNEVKKLHGNNIRLRIIGERTAFPEKLQALIRHAEEQTQHNTGLVLVIAANYGGRWDITQASRYLAHQVEQGLLTPQEINESLLAKHLSFADLPEPDLFIRTGGEQRISNFLLWQLAYTELYFTDTLWPDFDADAFQLALTSFATRQRRFGRTGDQVEQDAQAKNSNR